MYHRLKTPGAPEVDVAAPTVGDFLVANAVGLWAPRALVVGDLTAGTVAVANGGTGLTTLTAHALYVGNGTSAPTALSVGASGSVLAGSTGADPAFTATPTITTMILTNPLGVASGGTGLATLTAHALYVGTGASAPTALSVGATGTVLAGVTGADPAWTNAPALTSLTVSTSVGFFGASLQTQKTSTEILTNNVTVGGTTGTVDNVVAAGVDVTAAQLVATRNAIYQLTRKVAQLQAALVSYGLLAA